VTCASDPSPDASAGRIYRYGHDVSKNYGNSIRYENVQLLMNNVYDSDPNRTTKSIIPNRLTIMFDFKCRFNSTI
jgi:hypothetical protein